MRPFRPCALTAVFLSSLIFAGITLAGAAPREVPLWPEGSQVLQHGIKVLAGEKWAITHPSFLLYAPRVNSSGHAFGVRKQGKDADRWTDDALRWLRKIPLLVDGDRQVAETSVIIEYLQLAHPGPVCLIPTDAAAALDVRFMDRFFDLHVMDAAQHAVNGAITGDALRRSDGLALSVEKLDRAYAWLETRLVNSVWVCGDEFMMADCAAAPSLFYADWVHPTPRPARSCAPIAPGCWRVHRWRARWMKRGHSARCSRWVRPTTTDPPARLRRRKLPT